MNVCSNPPAETIKFLRTLRLYFDNGFTIDRLLDLSYLRIFQYEGALRSIVDDGELDLSILANKENFTAFTPISDGKLSGIGEGMLSIKGYGAFHFDLGKNGQTLKISNDAYTVSTKTIHSLELLHLDTCGSISVPSLNGERHCLSIVDVYIRWTSI
ncbi:hypothetical protein BOH78_4371, partial [Pichia kudriavzevii]